MPTELILSNPASNTSVFASTGSSGKFGDPIIVRIGRREFYLGNPPGVKQTFFINAAEREQLIGGAKRGAKSVSLCQKLALMGITFPGNRLGLFRQDLTDLRESTLVTWDKIIPAELVLDHHQTHRLIYLRTNGKPSVLHYGGLGDIHNVESAKGWEYGEFAVDEPSECAWDTIKMLLAQLCWTLPDGSRPPYMALFGSNPEPGWVEERFRPLIAPTEDDPGLWHVSNGRQVFIKMLPSDNPYLPPDWEQEQEIDAPKEWVDKYLRGSWKVSVGQVYKEFDEKTHCVEDLSTDYLYSLKLVASIDVATTGVNCMVIEGIDPDNNTISLYEYYAKDKLWSFHAEGMKRIMEQACMECGKEQIVFTASKQPDVAKWFYGFEYVLIDPSSQNKTLQNKTEMYSIQDEYRRNGIPTMQAYNALEAGINLVKEYLHVKKHHRNPFTGEFVSPSTFIRRSTCPNLVREIRDWKVTFTPTGAKKYVGTDHAIDNKRYIIASRPEPPKRTEADLVALDSVTRKMVSTHEAWGKKFDGLGENSNQWFGAQL